MTYIVDIDLQNWIYSSIPEDIKPATNEDERDKVFFLLESFNEYVTAVRMSKILGHEWSNNSCKVRRLITELIEFNGAPIISSGKGFKLARNKDELLLYHENLIKRMQGLRRRIASIERIIAFGSYRGG